MTRRGATAGYSGTPLVNKLGIKPGARLDFVSPPRNLATLLGEMPEGTRETPKGEIDFGMVFVKTQSELRKRFAPMRDRLVSNGLLWVSWPKKSSGAPTDLTEDVIRQIGLAEGLVDVKVCAVDETWSGLKFVRRLKDR